MYYKEPLVPNVEHISIFFHQDYPHGALKRVIQPRVFKKMVLGIIQAETSFRSANWVDRGVAGITSVKKDSSLDSLKKNFPPALLKYATHLPGPNPAYDDVGFRHSSVGANTFSPSASAVATYIANRTARNIADIMTMKSINEEDVSVRDVKKAFVKALTTFRGVSSLSRMKLHTQLIKKWSGIDIRNWEA